MTKQLFLEMQLLILLKIFNEFIPLKPEQTLSYNFWSSVVGDYLKCNLRRNAIINT